MKRKLTGVTAVAGAVLAIVGVEALRSRSSETPAVPEKPAVAAVAAPRDIARPIAGAPPPTRPPDAVDERARAPIATPPVQARADAAVAAASEPDSRVVELCGIGRMPVPAGFDTTASDGTPAPPNPLIDYAVQAARPRFQAVLRAGNAADRAAGLLMNFDMVPDASGRVDVPRPLLTLALQVRNPRILAAAMGQCARDAADGRCAAVARAWTGFEPDNAAAWLALQGADPTATPDALRGLASANRHQLHYGWLAAQVQARMPADIPAYVQMLLTIEAIGREAAFSVPPMQPLLALCRDAARGGEGMQAACTRLADVMRTIPTPWSG